MQLDASFWQQVSLHISASFLFPSKSTSTHICRTAYYSNAMNYIIVTSVLAFQVPSFFPAFTPIYLILEFSFPAVSSFIIITSTQWVSYMHCNNLHYIVIVILIVIIILIIIIIIIVITIIISMIKQWRRPCGVQMDELAVPTYEYPYTNNSTLSSWWCSSSS